MRRKNSSICHSFIVALFNIYCFFRTNNNMWFRLCSRRKCVLILKIRRKKTNSLIYDPAAFDEFQFEIFCAVSIESTNCLRRKFIISNLSFHPFLLLLNRAKNKYGECESVTKKPNCLQFNLKWFLHVNRKERKKINHFKFSHMRKKYFSTIIAS